MIILENQSLKIIMSLLRTQQMGKYLVLLFFIILILPKSYTQETYYYPVEDWEYIENESLCNHFQLLTNYIVDSMNTTGLVILKDGKIAAEYGDVEELSYLASARKSLLSMLYGNYVTEGVIDLNATLEELEIDDKTPLNETEKQATIDQIINARSGVYLPASNAGSGPNRPERGEYLPGEHFYYNNWDFNAAGSIFEKLTGQNIYEAFETDIAIPIGMRDFSLSEQKKYGDSTMSYHPAYHFYLSTRDMARIGYLMLRNGKWKDQQIIPEEWVEKTTKKVSDTDDPIIPGYGYMWWIFDGSEFPELEGAYSAMGAYGQYITAIPKLDIVIALKTKSIYRRRTGIQDYNQLIRKILKGEKQSNANVEIDINDYLGGYVEDSAENPFTLKIISEDGSLKLTGPPFPTPVPLEFCSKNSAIVSSPDLNNPQILFTRNGDKNVDGIYIPGPNITLHKEE